MEPEQGNANSKKIIAAVVVLVVVVLIVVGVKAFSAKDKTADSATTSPTSSSASTIDQTSDTDTSSISEYKDGTYTAVGEYQSPGGQEAVKVTVTLADGLVMDSSVTSEKASEAEAEEYQHDFIGGYKKLVTAKSIDSIELSRVSGSSLTSSGFNSAIEQIKTKAKS